MMMNEQQHIMISSFLHSIDHVHHDRYHRSTEPNQQQKTFVITRTTKQKFHLQAIAFCLKKIGVMVLKISQSNILYIIHEDHWKQKVNNYLEQIGVFSLIGNINSNEAENNVKDYLKTISDRIVGTLHDLFLRKAITTEQYEQMMYGHQMSTFIIKELSFIPDINDVCVY